MTKQPLVLSLLLGFFPALATAQPDRFRVLDRNGDGFISSEEWYGGRAAPVPFTVVDSDGDGRISEREFRDWSAARRGSAARGLTSADRFGMIDKNKDRFLAPDEWSRGAFSAVPFEAVDLDGDGKISVREFKAWDTKRSATVAKPAVPPGTAAPTAPSVSAPLVAAPRATTNQPALTPPTFPTLSTSPGATPGASSPSMTTGSGLTTK